VRTRGWPGSFNDVPWPDIAARFRAIRDRSPEFQPMVAIVESVVSSGAGPLLAGLPSMTDLVVVSRPVTPPPMDEVIVRYHFGAVSIEHFTHTGHNDKISRAGEDAVALFWRFMIEKFGVHPTPDGAPPGS
jgi:hypothetical protein